MKQLSKAWHALRAAPLHTRLRLLRWNAPLLVLALAAMHQLVVQTAVRPFSGPWSWWIELLIYSFTGSVMAWMGLTIIARAVARRAEAEEELRYAFQALETNHNKLLVLDRLGQHIARADDEQAILDLAAQAPLQLTDARSTTVVTFDPEGERLKLDMAWGLSDSYLRALRARLGEGLPAERCRHCSTLHASVTSDCPLFAGLQDTARREGIHSLVCLPIQREAERIGILAVYFSSADGPPEDQIRLLNILSGVIASALYGLRLRARQIEALHALDRATQTAEILDDLCAQVLDIAVVGWEGRVGGLFLYDEQNQAWSCRAQRGLENTTVASCHELALHLSEQARQSQGPVIIPELDEPHPSGIVAAVCAPLITEGRTLGTLFLGTDRAGLWQERHRDMLATMAHQIALAVRNAQLYLEVQEMAVVRERLRLAREIHDGLAQTLGLLNLQVEHLSRLLAENQIAAAEREMSLMRETINEAYVEVREAIDGLRLNQEAPKSLAQNLATYVQLFGRQTGIEARFTASPPDPETDSSVALQVLRIAQEALTNVRKHARASHVEVQLLTTERELELSIADDGVGFRTMRENGRRFRSHGLSSMRERAESLGGSLTVATEPGLGTRVTTVIPYRSSL